MKRSTLETPMCQDGLVDGGGKRRRGERREGESSAFTVLLAIGLVKKSRSRIRGLDRERRGECEQSAG